MYVRKYICVRACAQGKVAAAAGLLSHKSLNHSIKHTTHDAKYFSTS
jgi:hypothetical protein